MTAPQAAANSAARSQRGKARPRNEDAFLDCPQQGCWAVADGMGGHRAGHRASQGVVDSLAALPAQGTFDQRIDAVRRCLQRLNQSWGDNASPPAEGRDDRMGSTVVVLLLEGRRAACIWAGDSRCYLWRGGRLYQLSRDHSLLRQLMDEQRLSLAQAQAHPDARALTRAVGARHPLKLEVLELGAQPGDVFVLCSDGVYQAMTHAELGCAMDSGTPQQVVARLFTAALRGPARDDLTAVAVRA
ncbi:PP2C family protein-serine/threonine phosphatase [Pseudomonas salomonii]|uniref:SpoIIE family protein phosphatase n=1 Tax=Pseudomonas salomonii TaxID=191391 RepID=A0ABS9GM05_9PSED|nr:PP2C family serine/threonine-protein phosphatase [Pseudomonas salomonii]MCF5546744.1 SpoIIE family protein phosphatase [Pseudomonas salomonii]